MSNSINSSMPKNGEVHRRSPVSVDVETIMKKWQIAEGSAEHLFRFLETHRVKAGHDGFYMFRLSGTGGASQIAVSCNQCNEEVARTRNPVPHETARMTTMIWDQMIREAKIELKVKQRATGARA